MRFAILGLGEAGGAIAADLNAAGAAVFGWDPKPKQVPDEVRFMASNPEAVSRAEVVLSVNWDIVSVEVAEEVLPVLTSEHLYADLNTASPNTKQRISAIIQPSGAQFADVAIMAPILPKGIGTPTMASGSGAQKFHELMSKFGMPVTVLDDQAGSAAQRKLLRSTFYKGVAAVLVESLDAAGRLGLQDWLREQILTIIPSDQVIDRMLTGSLVHAERRVREMTAVSQMLREISVSPYTTDAAVRRLIEIRNKEEDQG